MVYPVINQMNEVIQINEKKTNNIKQVRTFHYVKERIRKTMK